MTLTSLFVMAQTFSCEAVSLNVAFLPFQGRRLKCDHCKHKSSYTLDYARHVDTHPLAGLACRICQCEVASPREYGEHMEIHHPSVIFAKPAPEPQQPQLPDAVQVQESASQVFSGQDLLAPAPDFSSQAAAQPSTDAQAMNPLPGFEPTDPNGSLSNPLPSFNSSTPSNNLSDPMASFTSSGSTVDNPLVHASDDFLNEDAVLDSILNGEQTSSNVDISNQQPAPVQTAFR